MRKISIIINFLKWLMETSKATGKSPLAIFGGYLRANKRYRISKDEYRKYRFYDSDETFIESFLSFGTAWKFWEVLNPKKYACLARDKYISHCLLDSVNIPQSELYLYYNPQFASNTNDIAYNYEGVLNIIKQKNIKQCVIKVSQDSAHGQGVIVCYDITIEGEECKLTRYDGTFVELRSILGNDPLLFESLVIQNRQFASFNASSVNTIRMMTALYPDNSVKLYAAFIKIGRNGSDVDNAGSGGNVDVAIDIPTGKLYNAIEFNSWHNIVKITHHPDTNNPIEGELIQNWDKIVKDVCDYQARIPQLKVIGWDIAITDDGPIVIEMNNWWDTTGQLFLNRGWKPEVMDCYNAWVKYNNTKNK